METIQNLKQRYSKAIYQYFFPHWKEGKNFSCFNHSPDKNPSYSVYKNNGEYRHKCFGCNISGDSLDIIKQVEGITDTADAIRRFKEIAGLSSLEVKKKIVKTYDYRDAEGNLIFQCVRFELKDFKQRRPDPNRQGKWIYNLQGVSLVPYNLQQVIKSNYVFIVEGEKDSENLKALGFVATTNPMGAAKWRPEYNEYFKDKKVFIIPDNDKAGKDHALQVAKSLHGIASSIKIIELQGLPEKGDISDWLDQRDVKEPEAIKAELKEIVKQTPEWQPAKEPDLLSSLETWNYIQSLDIKFEWIVDRLIPKESITLVFGKGGIGKTWLLLDIARCIGSGIPFLNHYQTMQSPIIFIDFENPLPVLNTRTKKLGNAENVYFLRANREKVRPPKLDSKEWEFYKQLPKGAVLIFDTLRASNNKDENSSQEMGLIMERLKELRDMGFTIILLHHTAKNFDKVAKGSTAIVDLADHILGLTLVKKKQGGQDVVLDDEDDTDEEVVYKFGVREKTRFEPYHIYLTLNADRGFELAPDPQEDTLKEMHRILAEHKELTKTAFAEKCKGLAGDKKLRKLIELGQGRYWAVNKGDRHTYLVSPFQFGNSAALYSSAKLPNYPDYPKNEVAKLEHENSQQTLDNTEFGNSAEGSFQIAELPETQDKCLTCQLKTGCMLLPSMRKNCEAYQLDTS